MDDVFDLAASDESSELAVASRDWQGRMREVSLFALRDGLHDGQERHLQSHFDSGVRDGFTLVSKLAFTKGKLLALMAVDPSVRDETRCLKISLESKEDELITTFLKSGREAQQFHISVLQEAANLIKATNEFIEAHHHNK
ncbi:hypothetical protein FGIG_09819 [Fasciola gigantica]|uniref:Uncharacterized protein n=1 Tax=Fasciola gigantica TaxID=46835 RepID=A0A504YUV9_FASGI|nr:hypothetical protein FGIG_09819 [Fasciola gigantica]